MPGNGKIFVSHAHLDNLWCRGFVEALKNLGLDVWYDEKGLQAGADWLKTIEDEIEGRDIFLLVLTPASMASEWVQRELRLGLTQPKTIIPVLLQPTKVTGFLRTIQWVDVIGQSGVAAAQKVQSSIAPALPRSFTPPARSAVPAIFSDAPSPTPNFSSPPPPKAASTFPSRSATLPTVITDKARPSSRIIAQRAPWIGLASIAIVVSLLFVYLHSLSTKGMSQTGAHPTSTAAILPGGIIKIASDLPTSGADAIIGLPTQDGVQLAIDQNTDLGHGYSLQYITKDDFNDSKNIADPAIGVSNMSALLADSKVMAVVGPFNSSVAAAEMAVTNASSLALISPSNTNPGITVSQFTSAYGYDFAKMHPAGKPDCYFRIPGNDVAQGTLDADLALGIVAGSKKPNFHKVYVVDDNETYGSQLADFFTTEFTAKGGIVVGRSSIATGGNVNSLAAKILATNPDFVFFGGVTSPNAGALKAALGANVVMEGGDGIADDPSFVTNAGAASINTFATVAAPDPSTFTSGAAATFASQFNQKFSQTSYLPYSAMAYDATMIEIKAIEAVIASGTAPTRANVCAQVAKTDYTGVVGHITFDQFGDNSGQKAFSIYRVDATSKQWVLNQLVYFTGG